jgi:hypothetical protein
MRLEFGDEPPPEICLPDRPLSDIQDDASRRSIQEAPYIIYRRYHLAHESWRLGIVYSVAPPTVGAGGSLLVTQFVDGLIQKLLQAPVFLVDSLCRGG